MMELDGLEVPQFPPLYLNQFPRHGFGHTIVLGTVLDF